jgi:dTDP-4-dehydrorhamnose reductase
MVSNDATITILGGRGMLGSDLALACEFHGLKTTVLDLPDFDMTNTDQLQQAVADAKIIVNCAAYTNVDKAEREPDLAYQVNAEAVGRLGDLARKADMWVLHISTDFVFDGKSDRSYVETDPPNPINTYGASKLAGEKLLVESRCHHCIMRLEWTYGSRGNNFVSKLIKRARAAKSVKVVDDQIGSPTATTEAAKAICSLVSKKPEGMFHFASDGYVSRFEMAKFVFEKLSMSVDLASCKTSDFASPATRPLNSRFDCSKIKSLLDEPVKPWQQPLEQFLEQL